VGCGGVGGGGGRGVEYIDVMYPFLNQMQQVCAHTYSSQHSASPPFLGMSINPWNPMLPTQIGLNLTQLPTS